MGVRSNTRAILKLSGCTFTYPGRSTPSLHNVSCALSLSRSVPYGCVSKCHADTIDLSRVGVIGPNGAGKSTLIKLLTVSTSSLLESRSRFNRFFKGETIPQEGTVYKHPALRLGYVSQHATHHIGELPFAPVYLAHCLTYIIERHLEKTPIGYIQWRFQDGHDREQSFLELTSFAELFAGEILEKATRVLTDEEKVVLEQEWVGKDGTKRKLEVPPHCYLFLFLVLNTI